MISYKDYTLTSKELNIVKKVNAKIGISRYIEENGVEPSNIEQFYDIDENRMEVYKRAMYSRYLLSGKQPDGEPDPLPDVHPDDGGQGETINIPNNEIWYTTYDNTMLTPNVTGERELTGQKLLRNLYENGKGVMTFDREITYLESKGFMEKTNLKSIIIPKTITEIRSSCFYFSGIESLLMPDNSQLQQIQSKDFIGCKNLTSMHVASVIDIGTEAFRGCEKLATLSIPQNCETIGDNCFAACSSIEVFEMHPMTAPQTSGLPFYDRNNNYNFDWMGTSATSKTFIIHRNSVGYYDGEWASGLVNGCGYTVDYFENHL